MTLRLSQSLLKKEDSNRDGLYVFKESLTKEEKSRLNEECWRFKHRFQCFHVDSKSSNDKMKAKAIKMFGVTEAEHVQFRVTKKKEGGKWRPKKEPMSIDKDALNAFFTAVFRGNGNLIWLKVQLTIFLLLLLLLLCFLMLLLLPPLHLYCCRFNVCCCCCCCCIASTVKR